MEVTINPAVELAMAMDDVPSNSGKEHTSCMYTFSSSAEEVLEKESPVDAPCDRHHFVHMGGSGSINHHLSSPRGTLYISILFMPT